MLPFILHSTPICRLTGLAYPRILRARCIDIRILQLVLLFVEMQNFCGAGFPFLFYLSPIICEKTASSGTPLSIESCLYLS